MPNGSKKKKTGASWGEWYIAPGYKISTDVSSKKK